MNRRTYSRRGFWIVESAVAIAVIGIGVVSLVGSQQAWHIQAVASEKIATGMRLASEIRELSLLLSATDPITGSTTWGTEIGEVLPFDADDLDDLDSAVFSQISGNGPIDATGTIIVGMQGWEQRIAVQSVDPFDITQIVAAGTSETVRIEVTVVHNGQEIARLPWIAPR